jgi:hypothetical protein
VVIVTSKLKLPFRKPLSLFRCKTCERIVIDSQFSYKEHIGHMLKQPCNVSLMEYIGLFLGLIK